jgi:hypothetical protein
VAVELPSLRIEAIDGIDWIVSLTSRKWVGEGHSVYLLRPGGELPIEGRFHDVGGEPPSQVRITPNDLRKLHRFEVGADVSYLDWYWGERAALVLHPWKGWERTVFHPSDSIRTPGTGWEFPAGSDLAVPDGVVIKDGWDHEHCKICWAKIGVGGSPVGVRSRDDDWVCEDCHTRFVVPRSLGFVIHE